MKTKVVLLGTGTPNAEPWASGPATAVIVGERAYLVDFGPGVVRQCSRAYEKGITQLHPSNLTMAFCTHLHTDHTAGYSDLIFTPWVLERSAPLTVYFPKGIREMTEHIQAAYQIDTDFRIHGFEKANPTGYQVQVHEIREGKIYEDELIKVEAIAVKHGTLESYAFRFITPDQTILISGDTAPLTVIQDAAAGCDLLLHEVEYTAGLKCRTPQWQKYHQEVHTLSSDLAEIARKAKPKLLVTYHRIYHLDIFAPDLDIKNEVHKRSDAILEEIRQAGYDGKVVNGEDLDVIEDGNVRHLWKE